ncbi:SDR family NAD(P)-dependent oxidoreductase [Microlunatus antarcticus]|uniref:NAD(P)-dependent dehydrogenase (Short-subunit alcohol dehydrogenase family) n=1 Tax=Microlunatus antarcticus TaxID=53388 RepID=A0A7W5JRU5_9ACTN|nr:SDR family NAD(P)-dependent oxidoreductase [Microlunatus antarcticus]MBB3325105.1 NAD(P)-dependent dehydrogenase (short-subunit alcohol dehydrogenase family) [Microlunatus antarcticus]
MATICITGATDGIGLATAERLLAAGHRVLVHARNPARGQAVVDRLEGDAVLVTGDLASLAEVESLANQIAEHAPIDVLVQNAGVWVRGDVPPTSVDGFETTFAVNVLAPHLLTARLAEHLTGRLIWLGSGMAGSGHPDAEDPGAKTDPSRAYSDSKASDVLLASAWGRRLPQVSSVAVDPGWVKTKLASNGAPGTVDTSAESLTFLSTEADLGQGLYWRGRRTITVPKHLRDEAYADALAATCDRYVAETSGR